jgi:hypothetical protein
MVCWLQIQGLYRNGCVIVRKCVGIPEATSIPIIIPDLYAASDPIRALESREKKDGRYGTGFEVSIPGIGRIAGGSIRKKRGIGIA